MAFQMWSCIWGRWNQHRSSLYELEIWQIAFSARNICLLSSSPLVNTDASYEENQLWDWKSETQIISETFCMWLIPHCTAVSCPWGVKPKLEVVFQLMAGSGSISHKWDYPQCNSVQGKFPLHFTSIPFTGLHSRLWRMMVLSWLWTLGHLYKSSALGDPSPPWWLNYPFPVL